EVRIKAARHKPTVGGDLGAAAPHAGGAINRWLAGRSLHSRMATTTLRRTVDVVTGLAAVGLVAFVTFASATQIRERKLVQEVAADLARFRQVLAYKAASKQVEINGRGWPTTVDPEWFGGEPPRNPLVTPERPWVEIAPPDEAELSDPPVRMAISPLHASFWYNPYQGIVRARVPVSISDEKALRLYNAV